MKRIPIDIAVKVIWKVCRNELNILIRNDKKVMFYQVNE